MGADIRDRLKDAALEPSFDIDVDGVYRSARRAHVRNVATTGVLSVVALAVAAVLVASSVGPRDPVPPVLDPGDEVGQHDRDAERLEERDRARHQEGRDRHRRDDEAHVDPDAAWQRGSDADEEMMVRLVDLAADHSADPDLPLAGEVALGLGSELHTTRTRAELTDAFERARAWQVDVDEFRGRSGPFSALSVAAGARGWDRVVVTVGDHPHCSSPATAAPDDVADLRRVNLHPQIERLDSCDDWWMVSLYVTDAGEIAAATFDLWEP